MERLVELLHRGKGQAAPPWVIWEALYDPWSMKGREWFDLQPGEVAPTIIEPKRPGLVVWGSIWSDQPELRVRFDLEPAGAGSFVTWTLLTPTRDLDEDDLKRRRYRLNQLIQRSSSRRLRPVTRAGNRENARQTAQHQLSGVLPLVDARAPRDLPALFARPCREPLTPPARPLADNLRERITRQDVIRADSADQASLERSFAGVHGVYSVQNHHISGYDGEITQGKHVAEAVARTGHPHLVYASAGTGMAGTGIGSWETKVAVTKHMRRLGMPLPVLRPMAFMELTTERKFYPAASVCM